MRSRTPFLILAIGLLLLGIVALNVAAGRFAGGRDEETEAAETAAENTEAAAPAPPRGADTLARLPVDSTTGPADARREVTIGWVWTPEVQANPAAVYDAVQAVRKAVPGDVKVRVVNADAVPDAPAGIIVNGQTVTELPPNGALDAAQATEAVQHALGLPHSHAQ